MLPGDGRAHANRRAVPSLSHIFPRARVMLLPLPSRPPSDAACARRGGASRRARPRRLSAGFCRAAKAMLPDGLVRGGFLRVFPMPPRRCFPRGSSEAAFHGIFQRRRCAQRRRSLLPFSPPPPGRTSFFASRPPSDAACARRGDASRWARPRRLSAGFCRAAETMLADGLVQGGFLRDFAGPPRRCFPLGSSEAAFCGVLQGRRGDASRWARPRRLSAGFSKVAEGLV